MDLQESSTVFERICDTSSENGMALLTSPGVECLPVARRVRSLMPLLREQLVPLFNYQPGDIHFESTCFIAIVANLRHILQPVTETVRQYAWKEYINRVRTSWHGQCSYGVVHHGLTRRGRIAWK